MPFVRGAAHGGNGRLAGRSRDSPSAGAPVFHPAPALTSEKLQVLLAKIITRILRVLTRQGHRVEEEGVTYLADAHGMGRGRGAKC